MHERGQTFKARNTRRSRTAASTNQTSVTATPQPQFNGSGKLHTQKGVSLGRFFTSWDCSERLTQRPDDFCCSSLKQCLHCATSTRKSNPGQILKSFQMPQNHFGRRVHRLERPQISPLGKSSAHLSPACRVWSRNNHRASVRCSPSRRATWVHA